LLIDNWLGNWLLIDNWLRGWLLIDNWLRDWLLIDNWLGDLNYWLWCLNLNWCLHCLWRMYNLSFNWIILNSFLETINWYVFYILILKYLRDIFSLIFNGIVISYEFFMWYCYFRTDLLIFNI